MISRTGSRYAAVVQDVDTQQPYHVGDRVQVVFQSACPRNNLRTEDTFLTVERLDTATGNWSVVRMGSAAVTADLCGQIATCGRMLRVHQSLVNGCTLRLDCVPSALLLVAALSLAWRLWCVSGLPCGSQPPDRFLCSV